MWTNIINYLLSEVHQAMRVFLLSSELVIGDRVKHSTRLPTEAQWRLTLLLLRAVHWTKTVMWERNGECQHSSYQTMNSELNHLQSNIYSILLSVF